MSTPAPTPPPTPGEASSWAEFSAKLRELHDWCGTPKYRALSGRMPGLSPSAISNLIGKNPLSRPPENATLRFVEACLRYGGWPEVETGVAVWKSHWDRLTEAPPESADERNVPPRPVPSEPDLAPDPKPEPAGPEPAGAGLPPAPLEPVESAVQRWAWPAVMAAAVVAAVMASVTFMVVRDDSSGGSPEGSGTTAIGNNTDAESEICRTLRDSMQNDRRRDTTWKVLYECANRSGSAIHEHPRTGSTRIGVLDTRRSWFVCWTRGERHAGGNDIWYYTQGDRGGEKPDLHAWGFLPSSHLLTTLHPNPGVARQCPFK